VYGPPLAPGDFGPQLRGERPEWKVPHDGRLFPVDYPPLAMAAWRAAAARVDAGDPGSWHVALKLPAIVGDIATVLLLAAAHPAGRRAGGRLGALYWALPSSWLSSAALGYLDGAYVPLLLASCLAAAGARHPVAAGAALAAAALIKPTALVAAPAIAVALRAKGAIARATAAGLAVVAVALVPYALAGTLGTAVVHVSRIVLQERIASGYANPWWLLGALMTGEAAPVPYVRIDAVPFPVRPLGALLFAASAVVLLRPMTRRAATAMDTMAAAGGLFAAYGLFAIGVHVNHPHPMVLLLVAAGLSRPGWRWPAWVFIHGYALNILLLEGVGRMFGPRYGALEALPAFFEWLRLAPGFDLTLPLVVMHAAGGAAMLYRRDRTEASARSSSLAGRAG
jgi:hypothetical protein